MSCFSGVTTSWLNQASSGHAFVSATKIVQSGLVLNLDGNPNGTTWEDLSGNGYNGTLINNPTYTGGTGYLSFNGTNQYVSTPFPIGITNTGTSTMEVWVNITLNTKGPFINIGFGFDGWNIGIAGNAASGDAYATAGNAIILYITYTASTILATATAGWQMLTLTKNNTSYSLYKNGTLVVSTAAAAGRAPTTGAHISYMRYYSAIPEFFGQNPVACARIYNKVLSLAEIQQNFNAQRARFGV